MKTKLGISVGLLGAAIYLVTYFGGYIPAIIIAGYVLLCEENEWLKQTAVKALVIKVCVSFAIALIGLIPDLLSWLNSLLYIFGGNMSYGVISSIISLITSAISIAYTCLFLFLGVKALKQETIAISYLDKFLEKYK